MSSFIIIPFSFLVLLEWITSWIRMILSIIWNFFHKTSLRGGNELGKEGFDPVNYDFGYKIHYKGKWV
jgi:hypothetical protein